VNEQLHEIKTKIQLSKSFHGVFEVIVDRTKMSNYFIAKSGEHLKPGENIIWNFPEFDVYVLVKVEKNDKNNYLSYTWDTENGSKMGAKVTPENKGNSAGVTFNEKNMKNNEAGVRWLK